MVRPLSVSKCILAAARPVCRRAAPLHSRSQKGRLISPMTSPKNSNKTQLILRSPHMYRAFLQLVAPLFLANLFRSLQDMVDTFFIGQLPNSVNSQAAISAVWPLLNLFLAVSTGLAVAGVAVISQHLGAGKRREAEEYAANLAVLAVGMGVVILLMLIFLSPFLLRLMGADGEVLDLAAEYLRIRAFEMPFFFLFVALQSVRQAHGDTATPVYISTLSIFLNCGLTAVFVWGLGGGVGGAALATALSQIATAPASLWLLFVHPSPMRIPLSALRIHPRRMKKLAAVALPSAASQALNALGFLVVFGLVLSYGAVVMAAFNLGNKVSALMLVPITSLTAVLAAFVGQNIGAGAPDRARQAYRVSRNLGLIVSCAGAALLILFCRPVMSLFTNDSDVLTVAVEYTTWALATQPFMALFENYIGVFNGSGNTRYSFCIISARLWAVRMPLLLFFKYCTAAGRHGIWYAMVISNVFIVIMGMLLYRRVDYAPRILDDEEA